MYYNETIALVISLVGYDNALMATTALLNTFVPNEDDILINIGLCAGPKQFALGTLVEAGTLSYKDAYTYSLHKHSKLPQHPLTCYDSPVSLPQTHLADMESHAVFKAASAYIKRDNIGVIKIISDHFEPQTLSKNSAQKLLHSNISAIEHYINHFKDFTCQQPL